MQLTRIPCGAHSTANVWVMLVTAALAAAEGDVPGPPVQAVVAPMLRIAPGSSLAIARRANSVLQLKVPSITMPVTARQPLSDSLSASTGIFPAALFISTATGPSSASALSKPAATCSGARTSMSTSIARAPSAEISRTAWARLSARRPAMTSAAPQARELQ